DATTIALFSGASNVGTLFYDGVPDPVFTGGFAGIQSSIPFDRVELTFNTVGGSPFPAFAVDNVLFSVAVPEPSTIFLVLSGATALLYLRWGRLRCVQTQAHRSQT